MENGLCCATATSAAATRAARAPGRTKDLMLATPSRGEDEMKREDRISRAVKAPNAVNKVPT
jgi:hypothetical protein